jgi:hypothetical protein
VRCRYLSLVALVLIVSACTAGGSSATPGGSKPAGSAAVSASQSPASLSTISSPSPSTSASLASAAVSAGASQTPVASKAPKTPSPTTAAAGYDIDTVTLICLTDGGADQSADLTNNSCSDLLDSTLGALGSRASSVVRAEVGFPCPATDTTCTDDAIVGFKDGHLEGVKVDWKGEAAPYSVGTFHAVAASVWPWGTAATSYTAPAVSRPDLLIKPTSTLANRTPLPYCGFDNGDAGAASLAIEKCFIDAVRTGHAAEIDTESPNDPGFSEFVDRFTGAGPISDFTGSLPASRSGGSWAAGPTASLIIVDPDGALDIEPIETTVDAPVL